MGNPPFELYIFDLDGTLVDSCEDIARAVNLCRRDLGHPPLSLEVVRRYVGEGVARLMERALPPGMESRLEEAVQIFRERYAANLLESTRPYPGVPSLLEALRERGARLGLATNKPEAFSRTILDGLGLTPHFHAILGGDSLPERKPHPMCVDVLRRRAGAPPRERTLFVGDSRVDVLTARNAGVPVCAVTYGLEDPEVLAAHAPDFTAASPAAILEVGA